MIRRAFEDAQVWHQWLFEFTDHCETAKPAMLLPPRMATKDPRTYAVIGAAMEVHRTLGCGFLESVYQDSLAIEFRVRGVPFREQVPLPVRYRGERVGAGYKVDFLCFDDLIVELKAQSSLDSSAIAQTVNYLRAAGQAVGLLLNFGAPSLEYRRLIVDSPPPADQKMHSMSLPEAGQHGVGITEPLPCNPCNPCLS